MKLYKGDRIMTHVDKHQVDDCLEAGWSRIAPEAKTEESEATDFEEELEEELEEEVPKPVKKVTGKVKKIKPLKKKK